MYTSSDPNLPDLDFELVDERQQNTYLNESMIKDLLSSSTPTYRIVKPTTNKRTGQSQLRRQLVNKQKKNGNFIFDFFLKTDESPNKQRTPPNSTGTSLSPHSSSFLTRDTNPIRITNASNTIRMSSPATTKQLDSVTLLLKQTIAPQQLIQVNFIEYLSFKIHYFYLIDCSNSS
jgi:hypothetical protein